MSVITSRDVGELALKVLHLHNNDLSGVSTSILVQALCKIVDVDVGVRPTETTELTRDQCKKFFLPFVGYSQSRNNYEDSKH